MIDKNSPIPIYFQLEQAIREQIDSGTLTPGSMLPPERYYTDTLGISRMTVRQAINNLAAEGLLDRQKGKGTFIKAKKYTQSLSKLTSFSEDMQQRGLTPSSKLLAFEHIQLPSYIAEKLQCPEGDAGYKMQRLRLADSEPIAVETIYTSKSVAGDIEAEQIQQSFYQYLEQQRALTLYKGEQEIEAAFSDRAISELLEIPSQSPVLSITRTSYLENEMPFEYVQSVYRGDRYKFQMTFYR